MATRFTLLPPQTGDASEELNYRCEECGGEFITSPRLHAVAKRHDRHVVVDDRMKPWYGGIRLA